MCLGVPGQIKEIYEESGARMGKVNFGGIVKEVCLEYVPEAVVGDYAIVHVGFAITRLDEASALETLQIFHDLGILEEELNPEGEHREDDARTSGFSPLSERRQPVAAHDGGGGRDEVPD